MPGHEYSRIKCEPSSDDEHCSFTRVFLTNHESSSLEELAPLTPAAPAATPVCVKQETTDRQPASNLEVLEPAPHGNAAASTLIERHRNESEITDFLHLLPIKDEPNSESDQQHLSGEDTSDSCGAQDFYTRGSPKSWTQQDMDNALDALRNHNMTLTKASAKFGIPSTTLWQRAHRLGIDTPKKEGATKSWSEEDLQAALVALRAGAISANKASKAYGIPSSTLYKIARREGIRLSAPFNAAPVSWRRGDLARALAAIRAGDHSVQRAARHYGIPTGTLYGRCKREGIELSRSNPTPWSEDAMGEALEAVRVGQMSINQAAIHYNLPYSSLYGRFKRIKGQSQGYHSNQQEFSPNPEVVRQEVPSYYQQSNQVPHSVHHLPDMNSSNLQSNFVQNYNNMETVSTATIMPEQYDLGQVIYYSQNCNSGITTS